MDRPAHLEEPAARRLVEASAWRRHLAETAQETTAAFEAWLDADVGNVAAWKKVQASWGLFGEHATSPELLELRRRALAQAQDYGRERRYGRAARRWIRPITVAAALAVIAASGIFAWAQLAADIYRTTPGERRAVTLADGSTLQLDSSTEVRVAYSKRARELTLSRGQAQFRVARDVERPFSVLASGQKVIALGTAFNMDLLGKDLFVTLIEGRVAVIKKGSVTTSSSITPSSMSAGLHKAVELSAGEQLTIPEEGPARIQPASIQRATAWQRGQLVFDEEPLSSVIARINRYGARPIVLGDESVASMRISGVFDTGDIEGFVTTIVSYLPVDVQKTGDSIRLNHR